MNLAITQTDMRPEEVPEIRQALEDALEIAKEKGFTGLVNHIDTSVDKLIKLRSDRSKNRGREHRSPIELWKWFVIVGIVGAYIALNIIGYYYGNIAYAILHFLLEYFFNIAAIIVDYIWRLLSSGC